MKAIRFRVTPELIKHSLQLPENTIVRGLYKDALSPEMIWWIVLEGEDFPEVAEGAKITEAMPIMKIDGEKIVEIDWGLDVSDS